MKDMVQIYQKSSHNFTKAMFSKLICRPKIHDIAVFYKKLVTFIHLMPSKPSFVFLFLSKAMNDSLKIFERNLKLKRHLWTLKVTTSIVYNPSHLDISLISCVIIGGFLAFLGCRVLICGDILSFFGGNGTICYSKIMRVLQSLRQN